MKYYFNSFHEFIRHCQQNVVPERSKRDPYCQHILVRRLLRYYRW